MTDKANKINRENANIMSKFDLLGTVLPITEYKCIQNIYKTDHMLWYKASLTEFQSTKIIIVSKDSGTKLEINDNIKI